MIEDILTKNDPPKVDEYAGYTFIITDIPAIEDGQIVVYKLFLILGKDYRGQHHRLLGHRQEAGDLA